MTVVIGLCGPAGSGKSTIANYLAANYDAKRYAFATPLKEICIRTLDFSSQQLYGTQEEKEAIDPRYGFSPRWFIQRLGTQGIRSVFGEDVWWKLTLDQIIRERPDIAIVEDVRFVNEANAIRNIGYLSAKQGYYTRGYVWRLESPVSNNTADVNHPSEAQWKDCSFDQLIKPDAAGFDELYAIVDRKIKECLV